MVNREAVNCERVWREISNYLEGDVDQALRTAMDEHFRACPRCSSVLEGTRNVIRLYGDERMIEVPSGFGRRLERRLAHQVHPPGGRWSVWSTWLIPVAAVALIAGGLRVANSLTPAPALKSEHAQPAHDIPPEMQVVVTDDAKLFHVAGCDFIHNKDKERTLTAREAVREGYIPCPWCMRKYMQTTSAGNSELGSEADADMDADELRGGGH